MYICIYIYIYIYVHMYICVCIYSIHAYVYMCIYIYAYMYTPYYMYNITLYDIYIYSTYLWPCDGAGSMLVPQTTWAVSKTFWISPNVFGSITLKSSSSHHSSHLYSKYWYIYSMCIYIYYTRIVLKMLKPLSMMVTTLQYHQPTRLLILEALYAGYEARFDQGVSLERTQHTTHCTTPATEREEPVRKVDGTQPRSPLSKTVQRCSKDMMPLNRLWIGARLKTMDLRPKHWVENYYDYYWRLAIFK